MSRQIKKYSEFCPVKVIYCALQKYFNFAIQFFIFSQYDVKSACKRFNKMAYNLSERFPESDACHRIFDPGAYNTAERTFVQNKAPFLSKTPRITQPGGRVWTHAIYGVDKYHKIPNVTSMSSKKPRFPYEEFKIEEFEAKLCECGTAPCECQSEEVGDKGTCQAKVPRRIFKGTVPHSVLGEGISAPSRNHGGYQLCSDGTKVKITKKVSDGPPMYDTQVDEFTAFYRGCKWSRWTSGRGTKTSEKRPGPADYTIEHPPTETDICIENVRAYRRQTSRQPRYIEMVQQRNIKENQPGPPHYHPCSPRGTHLKYLGPKADRFQELSDPKPGPTKYSIKRLFSLPPKLKKHCHAKLPSNAPFNVRAERFIAKPDNMPCAADYDPRVNFCKVLRCTTAPFSSSAKRFTNTPLEESASEDESESDDKECVRPTWEFRSRTIRFDPLLLKENEPSPGDYLPAAYKPSRPYYLQYKAPFLSSEGRFRPWYNWIPVYGKEKTPGPGVFNIEKPRCLPAVNRGPLFRAPRFPKPGFDNPAPNEYYVNGGVETVLHTHNKKIKEFIKNKPKFDWKPPFEEKLISPEQRESMLFKKTIALLDEVPTKRTKPAEVKKTKMLRYFLYKHPVPCT